jgi:arylsulfatase A-like enzyme
MTDNKIYTHLLTDQYHYLQDGGATYQGRYSSWDLIRGQERDPWVGLAGTQDLPDMAKENRAQREVDINRKIFTTTETQPQIQLFDKVFKFIETNHKEDNWFLQIESFDPHEPFISPDKYQKMYKSDYTGPLYDNPVCGKLTTETPEMIDHARKMYAALLTLCDEHLGRVMDLMDKYDLWKDTLLVVCTDHGYCLGEHGWWAKSVFPFYNEVLHLPLFIWNPRTGKSNETSSAIVQMIDYGPTLLDFFNLALPDSCKGVNLRPVIESGTGARETALFGIHGTMMPVLHRMPFKVEQLRTAEMAGPLPFTKGCRVMKMEADALGADHHQFGNLLFDLENDYAQEKPINDPAIEKMMIEKLKAALKEHDAPEEQFERLGL